MRRGENKGGDLLLLAAGGGGHDEERDAPPAVDYQPHTGESAHKQRHGTNTAGGKRLDHEAKRRLMRLPRPARSRSGEGESRGQSAPVMLEPWWGAHGLKGQPKRTGGVTSHGWIRLSTHTQGRSKREITEKVKRRAAA